MDKKQSKLSSLRHLLHQHHSQCSLFELFSMFIQGHNVDRSTLCLLDFLLSDKEAIWRKIPLLLCPPTQSLALEVAWSVINHNSSSMKRESGIPWGGQERYMMNWMMIGNRLKLWLFIARAELLRTITMTQYICRSLNTHAYLSLNAIIIRYHKMQPPLLSIYGHFWYKRRLVLLGKRLPSCPRFLTSQTYWWLQSLPSFKRRWWEKTHLYVIIIKYQNDLRLVSHSSSHSWRGPMKFSIIVRSYSLFLAAHKTFTPTSWFTIRSPYSFGWCCFRALLCSLNLKLAMPHFRSRSYLCTQHDYPLSARMERHSS